LNDKEPNLTMNKVADNKIQNSKIESITKQYIKMYNA